jgi:Transposase, Mutator family
VKLALAEMYVQGVSTRKVKAITEQLCGFEVTSSQVSRATGELDEHFKQWRERPLGEMVYLQFDVRYEKVREGGLIIVQGSTGGGCQGATQVCLLGEPGISVPQKELLLMPLPFYYLFLKQEKPL